MKTIELKSDKKEVKVKYISFSYILTILSLLLISLSSCEDDYYGRDGRSGEAFISLTWATEIPEYLDAGTGSIPPTFKWGDYYRAYPGQYTLYYEGSVWNGFGKTFYAYEVDYEIWENEGEPGQPYGIDGRDGTDTFLSIECSPYGPYFLSNEKSTSLAPKYELLKNTDGIIEVLQKSDTFSMKITYKRIYIDDKK